MWLIHKWNKWKIEEERITSIVYIKQSKICKKCGYKKYRNKVYCEDTVLI